MHIDDVKKLFEEAAAAGDLAQLTNMAALLGSGDHSGTRAQALQRAAEGGHVDVAQVLLAAGADLHANGDAGNSLLLAARTGNARMVSLLLARLQPPSADHYEDALTTAVSLGLLEVVRALAVGSRWTSLPRPRFEKALELSIACGHDRVTHALLSALPSTDPPADELALRQARVHALAAATLHKRKTLMTQLLLVLPHEDDRACASMLACSGGNAAAIEVLARHAGAATLVEKAKAHGAFNHIEGTWAAAQDQLLELMHAQTPGPLRDVRATDDPEAIVAQVLRGCALDNDPASHRALCMAGMPSILVKALLRHVAGFKDTQSLFGAQPKVQQRMLFVASALMTLTPVDTAAAYVGAGLEPDTVERLHFAAVEKASAWATLGQALINAKMGGIFNALTTHCARQDHLVPFLEGRGVSRRTAQCIQACWTDAAGDITAFWNQLRVQALQPTPPLTPACEHFLQLERRWIQQAASSPAPDRCLHAQANARSG